MTEELRLIYVECEDGTFMLVNVNAFVLMHKNEFNRVTAVFGSRTIYPKDPTELVLKLVDNHCFSDSWEL